jgi:hypothetical protein
MFKEGNLVRLITEDGDGEVMRVLEDSAYTTTFVAIGNENREERFDTEDLELVAESALEQESKAMVINVNTMKDLEVCDQLNRYIVAVITSLRDSSFDGRVNININCVHYSGDDAQVSYEVYLDGEETIKTNNLGKSAHIALTRHKENAAMKIKAIPFYVEAAK